MPAIVVDIAPPDPPPALARALIEACSSSATEGTCRLAGDESPSGGAVAIVRWEEGELAVRVQVGLQRGDQPEWRGRTLHFSDGDARVERFRAVGLTIATLASEVSRAAPPSPDEDISGNGPDGSVPAGGVPPKSGPASTPSATPPVVSPPLAPSPALTEPPMKDKAPIGAQTAAAPAEPPHFLWLSASANLGPALGDGTLRYGGLVDAGLRPAAWPLFGRLGFGIAVRPQDGAGLSVHWETVQLGIGAIAASGPFALEPRMGVSVDIVHASVADPASQRRDSGSELAPGLHAGFDASFRTDRVGFLLGLDAWRLSSRTDILVKDQVVGSSPQTGWAAGIGLRYYIE